MWLAVAGVLAIGVPSAAAAAPCGTSGRPWVELSGPGPDLEAFEKLLRAELAPRGIDVCADADEDGTGSALATVSVASRPDGATIVVEVHDRSVSAATRVSRDLDLTSVPADGRSFTLAVVADELLRASWAELALATAAPPVPLPPPAPAPPTAPARDAVTHASVRPSWSVGLDAMAATEHWQGGLTLLGADLRAGVHTPSRLSVELRIGVRSGPVVTASDGEVRTTALVAGAGASLRLTSGSTLYAVDAVARVDVVHVAYTSAPNAGATGHDRSDTGVLLGAGADGWIALGPSVHLVGEVLADAPVRGVEATDGPIAVAAMSGVGVDVGAGIRVAF